MFESKSETTSPLAPLPEYLVNILWLIYSIVGCLIVFLWFLRIFYSCYKALSKGEPKVEKESGEETPCENAPGPAILPVDGNREEHEELKRTKEKNDKQGNQ